MEISWPLESYWKLVTIPFVGTGITVNWALSDAPKTVTCMLPEVAPTGTVATMAPSLQLTTGKLTPFKVSVLSTWATPKLPPMIEIMLPATALNWDDEINGPEIYVNGGD